MIYKYCRRCGKRLKGAENRARGYGRICYAKVHEEGLPPIIPQQLTLFEMIEEQSQEQSKAKRKGKAKNQSKGKAKVKKISEQGKEEKRGIPPHLEKTLTPTYKMGLLFTPHTSTPTPK